MFKLSFLENNNVVKPGKKKVILIEPVKFYWTEKETVPVDMASDAGEPNTIIILMWCS